MFKWGCEHIGHRDSEITGYWYTVFDSFSKEDKVIELYYIVQKTRGELYCKIQHYSTNPNTTGQLLHGSGTIRNSEIAFNYAIDNSVSSVVGAIICQVRRCDAIHNCLSGRYLQFTNMNAENSGMYKKRKILMNDITLQCLEKIPRFKKIKIMLGIKAYKKFEDVENLIIG